MLDLSLLEENQIKALCVQPLSLVPNDDIKDLAVSLFPIQTITNPIDLLYKNLQTYFNIRLEKKVDFDSITKEVLVKAKERGSKIFNAIEVIFNGDFMDRFKKRLMKPKGLIKPTTNGTNGQLTPKQNNNGTEGKTFTIGEQTNSCANFEGKSQKTGISNDNRSASSKTSVKDSSSSKIQPLKEIRRAPLTLATKSTVTNNTVVTEGGVVANLIDQVMCFCGKHVSLIEPNKQLSFLCIYCNKRYHTECMKREMESTLCSFCHLRKLIPNRDTKRVIFLGLLQKGRKKHEITFNLTEEDLSIQFKIQVRCFRIKEGCQNFVLFPDSATFVLKNTNIKEFIPIHRQSSLKYRKDEPFYLYSGLHVKQNKLTIIEKHPSKETKDERIVLQNHLIGIYLIEEKKTDRLVREYKERCFTSFAESKEMLDTCFRKGSIGDQISCEIIKIPLTCTLTTQKLKIPARGVQCTHFQCFDLRNYLELTINSVNPRWVCPLCRTPTFDFKIDIILHQILQLHKSSEKASEVIFLKTGEFKVFENQEKQCTTQIHNIYHLPIDSRLKRGPVQNINGEDKQRKKERIQIGLK